MQTSVTGRELIKSFESFKAKPYRCPAGVPTIGYGSTYYEDGTKVKMGDRPITEEEASLLLADQLAHEYEPGVRRLVKVPLEQHEFDALVSFAYNCGLSAFSNSTLLRLLNAGDNHAAANQFTVWVHGGGKVLPGLVRRRAAERAMFLGAARCG